MYEHSANKKNNSGEPLSNLHNPHPYLLVPYLRHALQRQEKELLDAFQEIRTSQSNMETIFDSTNDLADGIKVSEDKLAIVGTLIEFRELLRDDMIAKARDYKGTREMLSNLIAKIELNPPKSTSEALELLPTEASKEEYLQIENSLRDPTLFPINIDIKDVGLATREVCQYQMALIYNAYDNKIIDDDMLSALMSTRADSIDAYNYETYQEAIFKTSPKDQALLAYVDVHEESDFEHFSSQFERRIKGVQLEVAKDGLAIAWIKVRDQTAPVVVTMPSQPGSVSIREEGDHTQPLGSTVSADKTEALSLPSVPNTELSAKAGDISEDAVENISGDHPKPIGEKMKSLSQEELQLMQFSNSYSGKPCIFNFEDKEKIEVYVKSLTSKEEAVKAMDELKFSPIEINGEKITELSHIPEDQLDFVKSEVSRKSKLHTHEDKDGTFSVRSGTEQTSNIPLTKVLQGALYVKTRVPEAELCKASDQFIAETIFEAQKVKHERDEAASKGQLSKVKYGKLTSDLETKLKEANKKFQKAQESSYPCEDTGHVLVESYIRACKDRVACYYNREIDDLRWDDESSSCFGSRHSKEIRKLKEQRAEAIDICSTLKQKLNYMLGKKDCVTLLYTGGSVMRYPVTEKTTQPEQLKALDLKRIDQHLQEMKEYHQKLKEQPRHYTAKQESMPSSGRQHTASSSKGLMPKRESSQPMTIARLREQRKKSNEDAAKRVSQLSSEVNTMDGSKRKIAVAFVSSKAAGVRNAVSDSLIACSK